MIDRVHGPPDPADPMAGPGPATRAETVERYLEVAADLVNVDVASEPAFAHVASHVKLTAVAANLGVSRTSLYRQWATQHDYWRDLVTFMIERFPPAFGTVECADLAAAAVTDLLEQVRLGAARVEEHLVADPRRVLCTSLLGYPPVPEIMAKAAAIEGARRAEVAAALDRLLTAAGRSIVEPFDAEDLVVAVWVIADGVAHCASIDATFRDPPLLLDGDHDRPWTLTGYAARCVLLGLTRPATAAELGSRARHDRATSEPPRRWSPEKLAALEEGTRLFAARLRSADESHVNPMVLGHLPLARVARAAGVTRRQLYHLWSSHEAFLHDLRAHLRETESRRYRGRFDEGITLGLRELDVSRVALEVSEHITRGDPDLDELPLHPRFAFEMHLAEPSIRATSLASLQRAMDFHQERIDALLVAAGEELREGLAARDLNRLITAMSHGSEVLRRLDPAAIRGDLPFRGGTYSLTSITLQAIADQSLASTDPSAR